MGSIEEFGVKLALGYFEHIVNKATSKGDSNGDGPNPVRDNALLRIKAKKGAVILNLGSREQGKTVLSYCLAKFMGRPTYAISPQEVPPKWITPVTLADIFGKNCIVPPGSTLICDDLPAWASNRDYHDPLVKRFEKSIPMVRHEPHPPEFPLGEVLLIINTQSSAQGDKYVSDCDMAFFKPLGLLYEGYERPNIKRIYKDYVNAYFNEKTPDWTLHHAWMRCAEYNGGIFYNKVTEGPQIAKDPSGSYRFTQGA
jgi:hypothetical protein